MDAIKLEVIIKEIGQEIKRRKDSRDPKVVYRTNDFPEIRDFVIAQNISRKDPEYAEYKSAIGKHFGQRGGHASATARQKKKNEQAKKIVFTEAEEKEIKEIMDELEQEKLMEDAREHEKELVGIGFQ